MSYASVAAHNVPPESQQPHPDPALLTTEPPSADNIMDDAAKINLVSSDFKTNPATVTSQFAEKIPSDADFPPPPSHPRHPRHNKASKYLQSAEEEGIYLWTLTRNLLFRPSTAGGILGLLNIGLLSGAGYAFYTRPELRSDTRYISSTIAATLALLGVESYAAETYRQTPAGQEEERRAKQEGAIIYRHAREAILRPGVLGGLLGLVNTGILGAVGYLAYLHWNQPKWDRRTVSAITVGLLSLWTGEGYLAERYSHPKRR